MSKDTTPFTEKISFLISLFVAVVFIQLLFGVIIYFTIDTWTNRGTFGDMFGVANSLFSGLALAGIVYAIFLQRRDLKIQREELELTRKELERSADAQEKSSGLLSRQLEVMSKDSEFLQKRELKESEPHFISKSGIIVRDKGQSKVTLINTGAKITNLTFEALSDLTVTITDTEVMDTGQSIEAIFKYPPGSIAPLTFRLKYENKLAIEGFKDLLFNPVDNSIKSNVY